MATNNKKIPKRKISKFIFAASVEFDDVIMWVNVNMICRGCLGSAGVNKYPHIPLHTFCLHHPFTISLFVVSVFVSFAYNPCAGHRILTSFSSHFNCF